LLTIELYKELKSEKEFILSKQFLRSATSVGANVVEAQGAISRKDFLNKMHISFKEIRESLYWIRLFKDSKIGCPEKLENLNRLGKEIYKILSSITKKNKSQQ